MNYLDTMSSLYTRGVEASWRDYLFSLMITNGEDKESAYALAYEPEAFYKNLGEGEGEYRASQKSAAEDVERQQGVKEIVGMMEEERRSEIQAKALNLDEYKFSGEDTIKILNSLLKNRVDDLDTASVKDVVQLLKTLTENGALDFGDTGFSRHFVKIFPKYNALCIKCGREFDAQKGLGAVCPHCHQEYRWSQEEQRYYPQPQKL